MRRGQVSVPIVEDVTDFIWQWGQFLDHDLVLTPVAVPPETFNIPVPSCDPVFDPACTGHKNLSFQRSAFVMVDNVREQLNVTTAFIDGSQVYGPDEARAQELRTHLDGKLNTSGDDPPSCPSMLTIFPTSQQRMILPSSSPAMSAPMNKAGLPPCRRSSCASTIFGPIIFTSIDPSLDDEGLYLRARAIVGAEIQLITYRDFLPLLLGPNALPPYAGYDETVNPSIDNVFAVAAYRFGHTMVSPQLRRLDANNQSIGDLHLRNAFFKPDTIIGGPAFGIDPYLRGLANQRPQEIDPLLVDDLRNLRGGGGFYLAALNIQRGRDHGMPPFNRCRQDYGLPALTSFADLTSDQDLQARLASAYATVDDVDAWLGFICETHWVRS